MMLASQRSRSVYKDRLRTAVSSVFALIILALFLLSLLLPPTVDDHSSAIYKSLTSIARRAIYDAQVMSIDGGHPAALAVVYLIAIGTGTFFGLFLAIAIFRINRSINVSLGGSKLSSLIAMVTILTLVAIPFLPLNAEHGTVGRYALIQGMIKDSRLFMAFWGVAIFLLYAVCVFVLSHKFLVIITKGKRWVCELVR